MSSANDPPTRAAYVEDTRPSGETISIPDDPGEARTLVDYNIGESSAGTDESLVLKQDGTQVANFYAESDGNGGVQNAYVEIGRNADATGGGTAVGADADASNDGAVAIGNNSKAPARGMTVIGEGANSGGGTVQDSVAIGTGASLGGGSGAISIGHSAYSDGIGIGNGVQAGINSVGIGNGVNSSSDSVVIGNSAGGSNQDLEQAVVIGESAGTNNNSNRVDQGVVIGRNAQGGNNAIVLGEGASADGSGFVVGRGESVTTSNVGRIGVSQLVYRGIQNTIADADLNNNEVTWEIDEQASTSAITPRLKDSGGSVEKAMKLLDSENLWLGDDNEGRIYYDSSGSDVTVDSNSSIKLISQSDLIKLYGSGSGKADVELDGKIKPLDDSGSTTIIGAGVTSSPSAGTEQSYSFDIDGTTLMKAYSEADGSGGIQNQGMKVPENEKLYFGTDAHSIFSDGGTLHIGRENLSKGVRIDSKGSPIELIVSANAPLVLENQSSGDPITIDSATTVEVSSNLNNEDNPTQSGSHVNYNDLRGAT